MSDPTADQTRLILAMLRANPDGITALDALREADCLRLAARIFDLQAAGYAIERAMVRVPSGKRVARYRLIPSTIWETAHGTT